MSQRIQNFNEMKSHAVLGKLFKKLNKTELSMVEQFIKDHDHLDKNDYAHACNRWMLDKKAPKRFSDMWAIVLQANI